MITQEYLKSILDYDPETGVFTWKVTRGRAVKGRIAGSIIAHGYRGTKIDRIYHLMHRLAFIWMTGSCPDFVDHINGVRDDNRWSNLRPATRSENNRNSRSRPNSTSKYLGVYWCKFFNVWKSAVSVSGKRIGLGSFHSEIEAAKAYDKAAKLHYGDFANLNFKEMQ